MGKEPALPAGGALSHLFGGNSRSVREGVGRLTRQWFGPPLEPGDGHGRPPLLNDEHLGDTEKLAAVLTYHIERRRPWALLSTNESTFYRYRRAAIAAFVEQSWAEIGQRSIPGNRPRPEYDRFVGRTAEQVRVVQFLAGGTASAIGIEGPGGTGKTALAQSIAGLCLAATQVWKPLLLNEETAVPLFDAMVWVGNRQDSLGLSDLLDLLARTLDYPGLLGREAADRRAALRDLLGRQPVLIVVDDADRADPAVLSFLLDLPPPSRSLLTSRRRLPPRVAAVSLEPLSVDEALLLLRHEGERQAVPGLAQASDSALQPLAEATRRFPLLTVWAAGQLRQGQTLQRVQIRLERAEGSVFEEMFSASVQALSNDGRAVLRILPLFPVPVGRAPIVAAAGTPDPESGIDELLEASLLEAGEGLTDWERRYALHPIARAFVRHRLPLDEQQTGAAVLSAATCYRNMAETYAGSVRRWSSFERIEQEIDTILSLDEMLADLAVQAGRHGLEEPGGIQGRAFDTVLIGLAHALRNFFWLRHYCREGLAFFHRAIEAARRLSDLAAEGWNMYRLAYLHYELGTSGYREARLRATEAVAILRRAGDARGVGHAMRLLGRAARERGDFAMAWQTLEEAGQILAQHGHGDDLSIVHASQADLLRHLGQLQEAAALYLGVLQSSLEDPATRATVLHDLGDIRLRQRALDEAEALFAQGERRATEAGARGLVAACRWGLAQVYLGRGERSKGSALAMEAAELFERLGDSEYAAEARAAAQPKSP